MPKLNENTVEEALIGWLQALGYEYRLGPTIAHDGAHPERTSYGDVLLGGRLRAALTRLNGHLPAEALDEALRMVHALSNLPYDEANRAFRRLLTRGIPVQVRHDGRLRGDVAWLVDFDEPDNNDWLAVNQFTIVEGKYNRRPDVIVFVNGLPLAVFELKNPTDPDATLDAAYNQIQTYKKQIPSLFRTNEIIVLGDGAEAKAGSLTAPSKRFAPWRSTDGDTRAGDDASPLRVLTEGLFEKSRFLDYIRHFSFWDTRDLPAVKISAAYQQFYAVNKAVDSVLDASAERGDRRGGVIWHTQGSGKSIAMIFLAGRLVRHPQMENPTLVVLTDRNDLDGQLFGEFAAASDLLPAPVQANSREHLQELLRTTSGGIIFTTIQKFGTKKGEAMPTLSERRNIIVLTDEAHRSHYEFIEGFARNLRDALPKATFLGFTGTPIELADRSTTAVFGDTIDAYTIAEAIQDGTTVPLYYEARLARIELPEDEKPRVDEEFEELTEDEEEMTREKLASTWAKMEALVGLKKRLRLVAQDIVEHFERRLETLEGKAMIVGMSRRICVDLYREIVRLRPHWHSDEDESGAIKVVMTGSATDPADYQEHIRSAQRLKDIERRFKDPADPLKLVIVRDMWLTGFNVPCAHTIYLDKPMKGHTLMQAIARVNRVFKDKPAGLVVDYLGVAEQLRHAVGTYSTHHKERLEVPLDVAIATLRERYEVADAMLHGFSTKPYFGGTPDMQLETLRKAADHVLGLEDGKGRFLDAMAGLNKAAAIALHAEEARDLRDRIGFLQATEGLIRKHSKPHTARSSEELGAAIRQIVSSAVTAGGVIDLFNEAGIERPNLSLLSEEFLERIEKGPHKNLQLEALKALLRQEVKAVERRNFVSGRRFSERLEGTLLSYRNRSLETAEVILELIEMARELREQPTRAQALGLDNEDEVAFYDALIAQGGVREVMGDEVLGKIAHDLVQAVRASATIDWTQKETVRAELRSKVKRLLRRHGYPPDKQESAVATVVEQAEHVAAAWA